VTDQAAVPTAATDRVEIMDVLRGVALFGVFLVNLTQFASMNVMSTELQLLSLPTAPFDLAFYDVLGWLFFDKANTLFAFLFGLGFYLQMQRLEARGADADVLYFRRLCVLLVIGTIHLVFIWPWDILHLYALAGFALLFLRDVSNRDLLAYGVICAVIGRAMQKTLTEFTGLGTWTGETGGYEEAAVLLRQQLSENGDYFGIVRNFFDWTVIDYFANGLIVGWFFYVLGRFLIGVWVGRHGWITRASDFLPQWRRLARWILPLGLALEGIATLLSESPLLPEWPHRYYLAGLAHLFAVPVLATGYVAGLIALYFSPLGGRLLAPFAWIGRMALTNYLAQSLVIAFVLFGVGPGLALAGKIGTTALFCIVVTVYAAQFVASRWWLRRFAYGPAEWAWRALTYGKVPAMRLRTSAETS
jgi:uncharacterized protein